MNNSALKLFHELMKKGWIDRNDNSFTRSLVPIQLTCRESSMKSPERRSNDRKYLDVFSSFEYGGSGIWNA